MILHVNKTRHTFNYVQGLYYVRLSSCRTRDKDKCKRDLICSQTERLSAAVPKNDDVCEYDFPSNVSADVLDTSKRYSRFYGLDSSSGSVSADDPSWFCDISLRAVITLYTLRHF